MHFKRNSWFSYVLKKIIRQLKSENLNLSINRSRNKVWIGGDYGGFYVLDENIDSNSVVFSFGIGTDISFDKGMIEKYNCTVFGFDPTPKSINWINQNDIPEKFNFYPYGIDTETGIKHFFLPRNKDYVSGSVINHANVDELDRIEVTMKSIDDIIRETKINAPNIIKMDIEGSEYDVIPTLLALEKPPDQVLIEFHHRYVKNGMKKTMEILHQFSKNGYVIFGVSDSQEEISLVRSDLVTSK